MAIPFAAVGYGNNSTARNVFGVNFQYACSSLVKYEAYDNDQTFPATDSVTTTTNVVLAGTTGNSNKSMVCLIDTSNATPTSAWKPASATAGEANPNRLKGTTNYVEQDGSAPAGNSGSYTSTPEVTFNMVIEVPSDTETTDAMGFDVRIVYTYTGTDPNPKFQANEGTEGSPTWTDLTIGTHGIKHCRSGSTTYANIPASGTEDTAVGYVTT